MLLGAAQQAGLSAAQAAYVLATAQHESRFAPIREIWGPTAAQRGYQGRTDIGNTEPGDGFRFRGRGYVQITGRTNYQQYSDLLGVDLVGNPDFALNPQTAATIAVHGMTNGVFTSRRLDRYINDGGTNFYRARRVVNGDLKKNGKRIAGYADNYLNALNGCE